MVKKIINGQIVDQDDNPQRPATGIGGGGLSGFDMEAWKGHLTKDYPLPFGGFQAKGWMLLLAVVMVFMGWGPAFGIALGAVIWFVVVSPGNNNAAAPAAPTRNATNMNPNFTGSSVTNTQPRGSTAGGGEVIDEERLRRMRNQKFGGISDVRNDKM